MPMVINSNFALTSCRYAERLGGWVILAPEGVLAGSRERGIIKITTPPGRYMYDHPTPVIVSPRDLRKAVVVLRKAGAGMIVGRFERPGLLTLTFGGVEVRIPYQEVT